MMKNSSGFTLIEFLIASAIIVIILAGFFIVQRDFFSLSDFFQESFLTQREAQGVMAEITSEIRTSIQSNTGGYPIEIAGNSNLAFYSNIDSDALIERVQYYNDNGSLKKSVIEPVGSPLTYSTTTASEFVRTVLTNLVSSSTQPIFSYYNQSYTGTSTPMVQPVEISSIRHVGIYFTIDDDANRLPPPLVISNQVNIRNLKY